MLQKRVDERLEIRISNISGYYLVLKRHAYVRDARCRCMHEQ